MTQFPPEVLRQYALLADGERGVLVGPRGDFAWMCAPRWDDAAVFSTLIGGRGHYAVTPSAERYVWGGHYDEDSLIWRSRWVTTDTIIECREALAFPGDVHRAVILRRVVAGAHAARVHVELDPRAGFGRDAADWTRSDDGAVWTGRTGGLHVRWYGVSDLTRCTASGLEAELEVPPGRHHDLVLEMSDRPLPDERVDPDIEWASTERAWREHAPRFENTIANDDARHSCAVLRGLTSSAGGMVAAATMSLPERAESGRNYDYRYAWIRDQCYAGQAVAATGTHSLLDGAVEFVAQRILADGDGLKPAYTVSGHPVPDERSLDLPGYPGGADKVGNWVNDQFQLDVFGEALLLFAAAADVGRLDVDHWSAAQVAADAIGKRWREADAGIWEIDNRRWAHSRLTCTAGLRAMGRAAPSAQTAAWSSLADAIAADAASDCLHASGRWQRSPDDESIDAALLMPAIRGAVPPGDPRSVATIASVREELVRDYYVYRFRQGHRALHDAEGAFLLCGFQMALAAHQQGETAEALRFFERNRAACGPPGLYSEEFDVVQRQLRGNLPQAFVHALLVESASRLADPWFEHHPNIR